MLDWHSSQICYPLEIKILLFLLISPGLKQATRQPENLNQFVNFWFVDSHCYCKIAKMLILQTATWT